MPRTHRIPAAAMLLLLAATLPTTTGGCANQTPQERVYVATQVYTGTCEAVADLREAGRINDSLWTEFRMAQKIAAAYLDEAQALADAGNTIGFNAQMRLFNRAVDQILKIKLAAEKGGAS